jgi:hypothetical protein
MCSWPQTGKWQPNFISCAGTGEAEPGICGCDFSDLMIGACFDKTHERLALMALAMRHVAATSALTAGSTGAPSFVVATPVSIHRFRALDVGGSVRNV